ncbi:polysaccharide deacetylase family protein [Arthrobacter sp. 35W]|uniref:polysaccharide deacetylase family protein n=1 Tax=Arthrobacter sp. 35W TaxID=1132441 RepID=UPI000409F04F|nr:polysaccharide deacetylase family protein [Arthrobacter sp. 35W]
MGAAALLLATLFNAAVLAPPAHAALPVTVTLTFDDANVDQVAAAQYMNSKGLMGTFFVPSGYLNADAYMTTAQALALQTAGNEIAGHTVTHPDLAQMGADEVKRQVCNDRVNLTNMGFRITSFAYPFASLTPAVEQTVADCGYNSARGLGDIASQIPGSAGFPVAETLPPADPFLTAAPDEVDSTWTPTNLTDLVTKAETAAATAPGGWIQYTFHHINFPSDPLNITTANFNGLIDFLAAEQTAGRIVVKTVDQVIGGTVKPTVAGPAAPPPVTVGNLLKNPGLETAGPAASGLPQCWAAGTFGTNTHVFSSVTPGHTGAVAEQLVMSAYTSGDAKLLPTLDLGECAPSATPGKTYQMSAWYKSTTTTQFELYYRTGLGTWVFWTASPTIVASANWAQTYWTSPPVPAGANAISVGLNLQSVGTLVTDDYELYDSTSLPAAAGAIAAKAAAVPAVGSATGPVVCGLVNGGCYQLYTNGAILWSPSTGAHTSMGDIRALWAAYGYERGYFGYPTSDTVGGLVGGGYYQTFQNGAMISSSTTGAHVSYGAVRDKWGQYGFQDGVLGYPTSDQVGGLVNGGAYQNFQNGAILWSPATGAHLSMGVIRTAWAAQGYEGGALRYPTTDIVTGLVNGGTYQNYQGGAVIWSAATGAQISRGGIRAAWASQGYENGRLGYPISNEYVVGGVTYQDYVGGRITWTAATGTVISYK